jgi:hypothetical protein
MDLKNAVTVCLISLFSATLVLLIARALDLQAASRIEPQLAMIVEELQALRKQGGLAAAPGAVTENRSVDDCLMVYYFHGVRCTTCRAAESNSYQTLESEYSSQLENGEVVWKVLDYMNDLKGKAMAIDFNVSDPTIVLVRMKDGRIDTQKRLARVLALAEDKPALSEYLQKEINQMLGITDGQPTATQTGETQDTAEIPVPETDPKSPPFPPDPGDVPVPDDLPVPDRDPQSDDTPTSDTVPVPDDLPVPE